MAAIFFAGILYGVWAFYKDWFPVPQIKNGRNAVQSLLSAGEPPWYLTLPGGRPQINRHDPSQTAAGLVLVAGLKDGPRNFIRVVDREGNIIHEWVPDWFEIWGDKGDFPDFVRPKSQPGAIIHGVAMASNGDVVLNFEYLSTIRLTPCGDVRWKLDNRAHHSLFIDGKENIWVSAEHTNPSDGFVPQNHEEPFNSWTIQKISADGQILETVDILKVLVENDLLGLLNLHSQINEETAVSGDTLHLNDVEVIPEALASSLFSPGDIMVSLRNINTIFVMDPKTHRIKFRTTGEFLRQHDPDFIGNDRIILFDNRNLDPSSKPENLKSRIMEIDAVTRQVSFPFSGTGESEFYTNIMGKQQMLDNGNVLITSSKEGRVMELTPDGKLVWEYNNITENGHNGLISSADVLPENMNTGFFRDLAEDCPKN